MPEMEKEQKLKEFFERAQKGVLSHIVAQGGMLSLGDMHEFSFNTYFIQHQGFSQLMEALVNEGLLDYDSVSDEAVITEKGRAYISK